MKKIMSIGWFIFVLLLTSCMGNNPKNDGNYDKKAGSEEGSMKGHNPDSVHMEENHGNSDL